jgi:DNA-3-methyladenine glycosylase
MSARLQRRFYRRDPVTLARDLLGRHLVRVLDDDQRLVGRIVETEAYLGVPDLAAHTAGGRRTARNESMYHDGGTAYVYFTYGMHHCMNVVAETADQPTAVLLRALQPLEGVERMRRNRAGKIPVDRLRDTDLCSGPAKLTQAMTIDRNLDGVDLTSDAQFWIEPGEPVPADRITTTARVGVAYAKDWADRPLRFYEQDNPHISRR